MTRDAFPFHCCLLPHDSPDRGSASVLPLDSSVFTIKHVDLLIQQNAEQHRTADFYASGSRAESLILRRGSPFTLQLQCSRAFTDGSDLVNFVFTVAGTDQVNVSSSLFTCQLHDEPSVCDADVESPSYSKKTEVVVPLGASRTGRYSGTTLSTDSQWSAHLRAVSNNKFLVDIISSPNAIVGEWRLRIETREAGIPITFHVDSKLYFLFNPWSKSKSSISSSYA